MFLQNDLVGCHYVEPYAGGAGLALLLLKNQLVSHIYLNDISKPIYALWHSIINSTDELCKKIEDSPVDMQHWETQKEILSRLHENTLLDLGFAALFLNRTNRSGILTGGVIGGKEQSGTWKMDVRFTKKSLIQRIQVIGNLKSKIHVSNLDALNFLRSLTPALPVSRTTIFLDPPYFVQGKRLYQNFYRETDHRQIACYIQSKIRSPWVVTYDNAPEIRALYFARKSIQYRLSYSASQKYQGSEIMFLSDSLVLPKGAPCATGKISAQTPATAVLSPTRHRVLPLPSLSSCLLNSAPPTEKRATGCTERSA